LPPRPNQRSCKLAREILILPLARIISHLALGRLRFIRNIHKSRYGKICQIKNQNVNLPLVREVFLREALNIAYFLYSPQFILIGMQGNVKYLNIAQPAFNLLSLCFPQRKGGLNTVAVPGKSKLGSEIYPFDDSNLKIVSRNFKNFSDSADRPCFAQIVAKRKKTKKRKKKASVGGAGTYRGRSSRAKP
jgi:hypothetical protein